MFMAFSKTFPKNVEGSVYPRWDEVSISDAEERQVEEKARVENLGLMRECLRDAHLVLQEKKLDFSHSDVINVAIALFEKRASHTIYHKERLCKDKFDGLK